jgi:hypothetical protein
VSYYDASTAVGTQAQVERDFLRQVFAWMFLALALTTGVAILFHNGSTEAWIANHPTLFYIALFGQLGFVFGLRFMLVSQRVSTQVAAFTFFLYAALTGVFAGMALLGYTTKTDLTRFGPILFGALIGVIAASFVYIFVGGQTLNLIIGYLGVIIFSGLTAYDMQMLKRLRSGGSIGTRFGGFGRGGASVAIGDGSASAEKLAIFGALWLYLDFINLFISLLRIFGNQR